MRVHNQQTSLGIGVTQVLRFALLHLVYNKINSIIGLCLAFGIASRTRRGMLRAPEVMPLANRRKMLRFAFTPLWGANLRFASLRELKGECGAASLCRRHYMWRHKVYLIIKTNFLFNIRGNFRDTAFILIFSIY